MSSPIKPTDGTNEVRISGTLYEDARFFCTAGGQPQPVLQMIVLTSTGLPYFVKQVFGTDGADHYIAAAKARTLKKGRHVQVYAAGLRAQSDHGMAGLLALGVSAIFSTEPPHHQPRGDSEATPTGALSCSATPQ
ncbi:MAG: hypothetical protein EPO09_00100 [Aquabacterium sp.]|uniref:hypothetical protein n=1 Tax=Aquabacterium sp. TaxID=1872578 RepID=UPI0012024E44|nr:hypothetical protein [Aquabacterium sp.]TAL00154.1 MAG: hypothetical protein EPO09_00100 [Aquabacterium sp.]